MRDHDVGDVLDIINGFHGTMIVAAGMRLGVFAAIDRERAGAARLAELVSADASMLKRLLNGLEAISLVARDAHGCYVLTGRGRALADDETGRGLAAWLALVEGQYLPAWSQLGQGVAAGEIPFQQVFGMPAWEHRVQRPELNDAFQRVMADERVRLIPESTEAIADAYVIGEGRRIVDVGGGTGTLLRAILQRNATCRGVLFEQPHVVDSETAELGGVRARCEVVTGSFFDGVPAGGDVYVLKHVLHNWDDEACVRILEHCRRAMIVGGEIVVVESVLPVTELGAVRSLVMLDLHMMCMHRGRERTLVEYEQLFQRANCRLLRVIPRREGQPDLVVATGK